MDKRYIDTHLAVDRYIRGTLTTDEVVEFEERLVWDQALLDEVDLAERLREGLASAPVLNEPADHHRGIDRLAAMLHTPQYAAAASFVVAVGLTSLLLMDSGPTGQTAREPDLMSTEIVPLFATRSSAATEITVSADAWNVLLIDAPAGYVTFRASVRRGDGGGTTIWARDDVRPTYLDSLALGMPGGVFDDGDDYVLSLEGIVEGATDYQHIQDIPFAVTRTR